MFSSGFLYIFNHLSFKTASKLKIGQGTFYPMLYSFLGLTICLLTHLFYKVFLEKKTVCFHSVLTLLGNTDLS
jgi:hypothetical protein